MLSAARMYFPSQAIQLTSCDLNSQFPSLQFHCQRCPVPAYMEVTEVAPSLSTAHQSNTPTEPFPSFLEQCAPRRSFLHCPGFSPWHCHEELRFSKVSLKFTQWLCRNTSEGNAQCSPHPLIFLLCRMQIHNLEGKTMATPEIFPILAGLGQLAKVTYSKGHENYTHDTNVQWNTFKFR